MATYYEWVIETMDGREDDADILDCNHESTLALAQAYARGIEHVRIGLVRTQESLDGRRAVRTWAYIDDEGMPSHFQDASGCEASRVPARFLREYQASIPGA